MVELYCELLLARANVLDQVAFGEKGARARSRAREEKVKSEVEKKGGSAAGATTAKDAKGSESSRSLFGFPFFGGGGQQKQKPGDTQQLPKPESTKNENLNPEEVCYIDPAIDEAAAVIFYAWPRFPHDVRELTIVRTLLADRYGKDFMVLAQENKIEHVKVPERVAKSLRVRPPTQDLVESYLREIAKAYGISWNQDEQQQQGEGLGNAPEFVDDRPSTPQPPNEGDEDGDNPENKTKRTSDTNELNKATPPRRPLQSGKSPVSVAPPGPRTDNPNPRVKVPGSESGDAENGGAPETESAKKDPNRIPEVDELSQRFAALRR